MLSKSNAMLNVASPGSSSSHLTPSPAQRRSPRVHSLSSASTMSKAQQANLSSSKVEEEEKETHFALPSGPLPMDFDAYLPWMCHAALSALNLTMNVTHCVQEDYVPQGMKKQKVKKTARISKSVSAESSEGVLRSSFGASHQSRKSTKSEKSKFSYMYMEKSQSVINVTNTYDQRGRLIEVAFINHRKQDIPRIIFICISMLMHCHEYLRKITVSGGGLTQGVIYEISKILSFSNITDLCLDDNFVEQGNYYILLEKLAVLKNLSLSRCSINAAVCEEIVKRLEPGCLGDTLHTLNLSSNFIGDDGARAFGNLIRRNSSLLHLNLADNQITHEGLRYIMDSLKEFELSAEDILKINKRKMFFAKKRFKVFEHCLHEQHQRRQALVDQKKHSKDYKNHKKMTPTELARRETIQALQARRQTMKTGDKNKKEYLENLAFHMADDLIGQHHEAFTLKRDGKTFNIGNLNLCSLNLAYNDLDIRSLKLILHVLNYQKSINKPLSSTGLIRLVIEGNPLPKECVELSSINDFLKRICKK